MFFVLVSVALAAPPSVDALDTKLAAVLDAELSKTGDGANWRVKRSPVLPGAWPPDGTGVVYAWAARRTGGSPVDEVTELFGRVRINATGEVQFERLSTTVRAIGEETSEPLGTKESGHDWRVLANSVTAAVFTARSVTAFQATRVPVPCPKTGCVRRHYENWAEWNRVGAWLVAKHEPAFFGWLNLPTLVTPPVGPVMPNSGECVPSFRLPEPLRWRGPQEGLSLEEATADGGVWHVRVDFSSATVAVGNRPPTPLSPARLERLRERLVALRTAPPSPSDAGTTTLLLNELWGATGKTCWYSLDGNNQSPAASAVLTELHALAP